MAEVYQRPDALFADALSKQHEALSIHQDGLDANVEKLQALNELMNICAKEKDNAGDKAKVIPFQNEKRLCELFKQLQGIGSQEFDAMLTAWVENLEKEVENDNPQRFELSKKELKDLERQLSTTNRKVEMDIQTIMNRFSYFKDMLYQNHTIAQSTAKAMERLHEAFLRVGRY